MRKYILHNRFTLMATVVLFAFVLIMIEGALTGRESARLSFSSPLLDIKINEPQDAP